MSANGNCSDRCWCLPTRGRIRSVNLRGIVNAIFCVLRPGCQWDYLPHHFPPADTVYGYFRDWRKDGTWARVNLVLRGKVWQSVGKDVEPSAAVIESQSAKTTEVHDTRGYYGRKLVKIGRASCRERV